MIMKGLTLICCLVLLAVCIEAKGYRPKACRLPVGSVEPCRKWYHDTTLDRCKHVPKHTCARTENAFYKADCQSICGINRIGKPEKPEVCSQQTTIYPCRRKYYDVIQNSCELIRWELYECLTGGNGWVITDQECNEQCIRPPHCFVDPDVRPCQRFYAVVQQGVFIGCMKFDKFLCSDGNSNNAFTSKDECKAECNVADPPSKCFEAPKSSACRNLYYEPDQCASNSGMCSFGANSYDDVEDCRVCIMGGAEG